MSRPVPRGRYGAVAVALCLAAAGGIVVLLIADSYSAAITLGYTAGALLAFGLAAAAGMSIAGGFPLAWIGWLCVVVAATAFGLTMGVVWDADETPSEGLSKAVGSLFVFSLALAQVCLVLGRLRNGAVGPLVTGLVTLTLLTTLGTATLLTVAILEGVEDDLYFRLTAVVAVLAALGTALVPVVRALRRPAQTQSEPTPGPPDT